MGEMEVPADAYYGASTQRAVLNFPISGQAMPRRFIRALGMVKRAAAQTNRELGLLPRRRARAIAAASWIAVGITSLDDWHRFTWSLGWTSFEPRSPPRISVARFAMTSFAFVFVEVPEPVW